MTIDNTLNRPVREQLLLNIDKIEIFHVSGPRH